MVNSKEKECRQGIENGSWADPSLIDEIRVEFERYLEKRREIRRLSSRNRRSRLLGPTPN